MSAPLALAGLLAVVTIGSIALTIGLGVDAPVDGKAPIGFGPAPSPLRRFQERACPCKNDWPLGTNERLRSNAVFAQASSVPDARNVSALAVFWGQLIDHDMVLSDMSADEGTFEVQMVPFNATLTLVRTKHRVQNGCREPENRITPLIDAGIVYGDALSPELVFQLRNGALCELRTQAGNLLPDKTPTEFLAGDERATEHSILAALHTLWMREHNRLCGVIRAREPTWTETEMFWKARQLVIAKLQKITYEEWLPTMFGSQQWMLDAGLGFKPKHGERVVAEWAAGAFRFGHSMVPDPVGPFALPTLFFNAQLLKDNGIEPFLAAAYDTTAEACDAQVVDGLRNFLFAAGPGIVGEDLTTRNLFRAREVGLGTYEQIAECYESLAVAGEQEFFVGMLQEPVVAGSSLPLNVAVVVAEQMRRTRLYDPNFYTRIAPHLEAAYEAELARGTLQNLLLDNTALENVRENVFRR